LNDAWAEPGRRRRPSAFLGITFCLTWSAWWTVAWLTRHGATTYGEPAFMTLYVLGGLGPTIAAYAAIVLTRGEGSVAEFHRNLFRWRVHPLWYLVALGLPCVLASAALGLTGAIEPRVSSGIAFEPWSRIVPLFCLMIVGGGLEELGWRGVAQPELERRMNAPVAALIVGVLWALWHAPLFLIPGVGQYQTNFPIFSINTVGLAFVLAWLYRRTRSILLCVLLHTASNTAGAMGFSIPNDLVVPNVVSSVLTLVLGVGLLLADGRIKARRG
jgi:membrane protease YdiL (CAAX protease family)